MGSEQRSVDVRPATASDWLWLTGQGLAPRMVGRQYHWAETPLQLVIAPLRGLPRPTGPRAIIGVDGRRAGYIGRNPLSGNLEYFLAPWARGGTGTRAIASFLQVGRPGDRPRSFFVSHSNPRSKAALLSAMATLTWEEGRDYRIRDGSRGWWIDVPGDRQ